MQIKRFAVRHFKNFKEEVVLDGLGKIGVIHGENNVGKSNLLEALQLFFLLSPSHLDDRLLSNLPEQVSSTWLEQLGFPPAEIFNLDSPKPIELSATFTVSAKELEQAGIETMLPISEVQISVKLSGPEVGPQGVIYKKQVTQYKILEEKGLEEQPGEENRVTDLFETMNILLITYGTKLAKFLVQTGSPQQTATMRFVLIKPDRRISIDEIEGQIRNLVPHSLCLQLYDARDSTDPTISKRWKLFVKTMQKFSDMLGEGEFVLTFNRHTNRANLAFDNTVTRIPVNLLGSGIQQMVVLIARLLVNHATFVAIEEPELNLRYTLQLRLREIFQEIVEDPAGPQQIFLTSHSPAFEYGEHFYAMQKVNDVPRLEKRPIREADLFTQHGAHSPHPGQNAPLCYVSTEGLVKLPDQICKRLGLEHGGGVVFVERKDGHVAMLTNGQFLDLFESEEDAREDAENDE